MKNMAAFAKWYPTISDYLCPNTEGLLTVDQDAEALRLSPGRREFFDRIISELRTPESDVARARRMLGRYAAEGPGGAAKAGDWEDWWKSNADYLFFGEAGGYRWYIDPLAKAARCRRPGCEEKRGRAADRGWRRLRARQIET